MDPSFTYVAAQDFGKYPESKSGFGVLPAKRRFFRVGDAGFEPATSAV
jgi:hypothetical protein